mmetsp:Transcript_68040/g.220310  ORF Transcript_68040/g.220310 Transcript_68040/m.220310 type:complete len:156 (+) Transcript_68040:1328-1795(+)
MCCAVSGDHSCHDEGSRTPAVPYIQALEPATLGGKNPDEGCDRVIFEGFDVLTRTPWIISRVSNLIFRSAPDLSWPSFAPPIIGSATLKRRVRIPCRVGEDSRLPLFSVQREYPRSKAHSEQRSNPAVVHGGLQWACTGVGQRALTGALKWSPLS